MAQLDYSKISSDEFDFLLSQVLANYSAMDLFTMVPDIQSEVMEFFNNDVLDMWASMEETRQGEGE